VEQEAPQKFLGGHRHQPLLAFVGIVFPAESDLAIGEVHDPVVGDGDPMRVAGQVVEDVFGPSEGSFGVDHPILTEQRPQKSMEGFLFADPFQASGEHQFPVTESELETGNELAAKYAAQHLYRQEEGIARVNPALGDRARDYRMGSRSGYAGDAGDSGPRCGAHSAVPPALAVLDMDEHGLAVDVLDLQIAHLAIPHAGRIEHHQHGAVQEVAGRIDQPCDFLDSQDRGQPARSPGSSSTVCGRRSL